jgi:hypothetical protein
MATKKEKEKTFRAELIEQMLTLTTSGFGLVAALAWNEAIQGFVKEYVQKYFPATAIYYKFFYAALITFFAVLITYQLSRLHARFQQSKR